MLENGQEVPGMDPEDRFLLVPSLLVYEVFVCMRPLLYLGSSTETVAFQVYEILKIDYEFLQLF